MKREIKCEDCGDGPDAPILRDSVWNSIAHERSLLCIDCTEKRLGRPIQLLDLRYCLGNNFIFHYAKQYGLYSEGN